jgi:exodeoxyribonuclease-3
VLVNAPLRDRLRRAGVDAEYRDRVKPSDHAPAWIELAA